MIKSCPVCRYPMKKVEYDKGEVLTPQFRAGSGNFVAGTGSGGEASGSDSKVMEKWWACSNCGATFPI